MASRVRFVFLPNAGFGISLCRHINSFQGQHGTKGICHQDIAVPGQIKLLLIASLYTQNAPVGLERRH